jgi:hypothetical protein
MCKPSPQYGTIHVRKNGPVIYVPGHRLAWKNGWASLARLNFELTYKRLEKGERVSWLDGNRQNCDPSNLYLYGGRKRLAVCAVCGNKIVRWSSELVRRSILPCCSHRCASVLGKSLNPVEKIPRDCVYCGNRFYVLPGHASKHRFVCSRNCQYLLMKKRAAERRPVLPCNYCGKRFRATKHQVSRKDVLHFCSKSCAAKFHSKSRRVPRSDFSCAWCGCKFTRLGSSIKTAAVCCSRKCSASLQMEIRGSPTRKLTAEEVEIIRASSEPRVVLAQRYGVSRGSIGRIKRGVTWKRKS